MGVVWTKLDIYAFITHDILINRLSNVFNKETKYHKLLQGVRYKNLAFDMCQIQGKLPTITDIFDTTCKYHIPRWYEKLKLDA